MQNIRYICAQPANSYYRWQVEVVINNFIKNGIHPTRINILCSISNNEIPQDWKTLRDHYRDVRFYFYNDTRVNLRYIPSVYFNLMSNHLKEHPELKNEVLFLHDCDIVFTRTPQLDWVHGTNAWLMSDTNSYINYDYIQQKGNTVYEKMCEIVGIDKTIPKLMNSNSGGAQYIVKGEGWEFWDKVEKDSIALYDYFCSIESYYLPKHNGDYPIQKWTSGMWSLLWNAWLSGHETKVDKRLDFCWSTDGVDKIDNHLILHNAGVTSDNMGLFYKGKYINTLPYNDNLSIDSNRASSYYWKEVQEAGKISPFTNK